MKISLLLSILIFSFINLSAQDYLISFAGTGEATTIDEIFVENLTQRTNLTLGGTDMLRLMGTVGIEQIKTDGNSSMRIFPNPMTEQSTIQLDMPHSGNATLDLFDITGKKILSTQNNLKPETHVFKVSGLTTGIYTVSLKTENFAYSDKIVSTSTSKGTPTVEYVNSGISENTNLKTTQSVVPMQYTTGDRIQIKAVSGAYSTIKTFIPEGNSTESFYFVAATDLDGNNNTTVTIGTQVWMVENLKTTFSRNGDPITKAQGPTSWANNNSQGAGAYCWYNNIIDEGSGRGALYNWYAVNVQRNIAPEGWHVPSDDEWTTLVNFLGGEALAGSKMKQTVFTTWDYPNLGATNETGFTALPAGFRNSVDGTFFDTGMYGYFWSSTTYGVSAWVRYAVYDDMSLYRYNYLHSDGISVRLIKN